MEAGGDALLGELMFDLLTCWCPGASIRFIKVSIFFILDQTMHARLLISSLPSLVLQQAQCILTTNKTLGMLMELANRPPPSTISGDNDKSLIYALRALRKRSSELPNKLFKKRADQFEIAILALYDELGTVESLRLLESCLRPVIVYVIMNLAVRCVCIVFATHACRVEYGLVAMHRR